MSRAPLALSLIALLTFTPEASTRIVDFPAPRGKPPQTTIFKNQHQLWIAFPLTPLSNGPKEFGGAAKFVKFSGPNEKQGKVQKGSRSLGENSTDDNLQNRNKRKMTSKGSKRKQFRDVNLLAFTGQKGTKARARDAYWHKLLMYLRKKRLIEKINKNTNKKERLAPLAPVPKKMAKTRDADWFKSFKVIKNKDKPFEHYRINVGNHSRKHIIPTIAQRPDCCSMLAHLEAKIKEEKGSANGEGPLPGTPVGHLPKARLVVAHGYFWVAFPMTSSASNFVTYNVTEEKITSLGGPPNIKPLQQPSETYPSSSQTVSTADKGSNLLNKPNNAPSYNGNPVMGQNNGQAQTSSNQQSLPQSYSHDPHSSSKNNGEAHSKQNIFTLSSHSQKQKINSANEEKFTKLTHQQNSVNSNNNAKKTNTIQHTNSKSSKKLKGSKQINSQILEQKAGKDISTKDLHKIVKNLKKVTDFENYKKFLESLGGQDPEYEPSDESESEEDETQEKLQIEQILSQLQGKTSPPTTESAEYPDDFVETFSRIKPHLEQSKKLHKTNPIGTIRPQKTQEENVIKIPPGITMKEVKELLDVTNTKELTKTEEKATKQMTTMVQDASLLNKPNLSLTKITANAPELPKKTRPREQSMALLNLYLQQSLSTPTPKASIHKTFDKKPKQNTNSLPKVSSNTQPYLNTSKKEHLAKVIKEHVLQPQKFSVKPEKENETTPKPSLKEIKYKRLKQLLGLGAKIGVKHPKFQKLLSSMIEGEKIPQQTGGSKIIAYQKNHHSEKIISNKHVSMKKPPIQLQVEKPVDKPVIPTIGDKVQKLKEAMMHLKRLKQIRDGKKKKTEDTATSSNRGEQEGTPEESHETITTQSQSLVWKKISKIIRKLKKKKDGPKKAKKLLSSLRKISMTTNKKGKEGTIPARKIKNKNPKNKQSSLQKEIPEKIRRKPVRTRNSSTVATVDINKQPTNYLRARLRGRIGRKEEMKTNTQPKKKRRSPQIQTDSKKNRFKYVVVTELVPVLATPSYRKAKSIDKAMGQSKTITKPEIKRGDTSKLDDSGDNTETTQGALVQKTKNSNGLQHEESRRDTGSSGIKKRDSHYEDVTSEDTSGYGDNKADDNSEREPSKETSSMNQSEPQDTSDNENNEADYGTEEMSGEEGTAENASEDKGGSAEDNGSEGAPGSKGSQEETTQNNSTEMSPTTVGSSGQFDDDDCKSEEKENKVMDITTVPPTTTTQNKSEKKKKITEVSEGLSPSDSKGQASDEKDREEIYVKTVSKVVQLKGEDSTSKRKMT